MFTIIALCCLITPIVFFLGLDPTVSSLLVGMSYSIAIICTLTALFGFKVYLLLEGADLDAKFNLIRPSQQKSSSGGQESGRVAAMTGDEAFVEMHDTAKKFLKKKTRDEKVEMCRKQIAMWTELLLGIESRDLNSGQQSDSKMSNTGSFSIDQQSAKREKEESQREKIREAIRSAVESANNIDNDHDFVRHRMDRLPSVRYQAYSIREEESEKESSNGVV